MILLTLSYCLVFFPWILQKMLVKDVRESDLYTRLVWPFMIWWVAQQFGSVELFIVLVLLWGLASMLDVLYSLTFRSAFTPAAVEAIFLTNMGESKEFIKSYLSSANIATVFGYLVAFVYLLWSVDNWVEHEYPLLANIFMSVLLLLVFYKAFFKKEIYGVLPGVLGMLPTYLVEKHYANRLIDARQLNADKLSHTTTKKEAELDVLVMVIGESSSPRHYGCYGYGRDTTPYLKNCNLTIFKDVISPFVQTNPALSYILTEADSQNSLNPDEAFSIVDYLNKSGVETYWISNQEPVKSTPSAIAKTAKYSWFSSQEFAGQHGQFDEVLLPEVARALSDKKAKKLIAVHLMGSHLQYQHRYPKSWEYFSDSIGITGYKETLSSQEVKSINQYDNSIRYTDHVVNEVIKMAESNESDKVGVLYFSDHGEEVYDTRAFKGHEPVNYSKPMFEVPMLYWGKQPSSSVKSALQKNSDQPMMLDEVFHSVLDLMGVDTLVVNQAKSAFSSKYESKLRIVYGEPYCDIE